MIPAQFTLVWELFVIKPITTKVLVRVASFRVLMGLQILFVYIINFEKVDKPEGGCRTMWIRLFCKILALF